MLPVVGAALFLFGFFAFLGAVFVAVILIAAFFVRIVAQDLRLAGGLASF